RRSRINDYCRESRIAVFGARALLVRRDAYVNARAIQFFLDHLAQGDARPTLQLRNRDAAGRRVDQARDRKTDRVYGVAGARLRTGKADYHLRRLYDGGARRSLRRGDLEFFDGAALFIK